MTKALRIGLLSDTHGWLNPKIIKHFANVDQIWHAGDIGSLEVIEELEEIAPVKAVYGNVDDFDVRRTFPEILEFTEHNVKVLMTHIGGYPGHYSPNIKQRLYEVKPKLFICGHSHICKVMNDKTLGLLHINPGAAGRQGFHEISTVVKFSISNEQIGDLEVIEFSKHG
ncbi:MAG TPA: metallophosphoesterase family protein [Salinivirgaceae bacterium]|nr:metallophosphoesterase family protein [Salinivirgaceae bacterium]